MWYYGQFHFRHMHFNNLWSMYLTTSSAWPQFACLHAQWRAVVSSTAHIPVSLLMPSGEQCRPLLTSLYHCSWALHQVHCTPALITPAVATCTIFMLAIADTVLKYLTHFHSYLNLPPYTPPPTPPPIPPPTPPPALPTRLFFWGHPCLV